MNAVDDPLDDYASAHTKEVAALAKLVEDETFARSGQARMMVGKVEGTLLQLLVKLTNCKRILEIGTFTGFSGLMMASALPKDGCLVTLERSEKHANIARGYFDRSELGSRIVSVVGDAKETLADVEGPFDLIFIDADKTSYDFYYEKGLILLRSGGLMVLDNMLWGGNVLDPKDDESIALDRLNTKILRDDRVENVLLTVRDGVMLVRKKDEENASEWRKDLEIKTRNMIKRERRKETATKSSEMSPRKEGISRLRQRSAPETHKSRSPTSRRASKGRGRR